VKFTKKTKLLEKFELLDKTEFELTEKRKKKKMRLLPPGQPPFTN